MPAHAARCRSSPMFAEIMCLEPKALRAAVERMMQLGDYDINTRLQKFLAETNEISGDPQHDRDAEPRG